VHVEQLLPRNQYLVTAAVGASALRAGRWVVGELGLTEEWLVFASGDPHDLPDLVLLDAGVDVKSADDAGVAIVTVTVARSTHRYRADSREIAPLVEAMRRLRAEPPSGTRVWRADSES
jgi:hypothetical protein